MMSLSSALSIISSSLSANASQSATVSRNVANANTPGYSREIANLVTNHFGGVDVAAVVRQANAFLQEQASQATSSSSYHETVSNGLDRLASSVDDGSGASSARSPSAMISALRTALHNYSASPANPTLASQAVAAAADLASELNSESAATQKVRTDADASMARSVSTINSLLGKFAAANNAVVAGLNGSGDLAAAQDSRDQILSQLSEQIGIRTTTQSDGSMSIYTDSGVTLFQGIARSVTFSASGSLAPGLSGNAVVIDGVPVTGAGSPMQIQSGALAGYAELRDTIAPTYQAQLDQIAGGLIRSFAEQDQTGGAAPTINGLFTAPGLTTPPANTATVGLAGTIQIAASVDPTKGGNPFLLRDGGIGAPGNPAYLYNAAGGASFTTRINQLADSFNASQAFDPSAGIAQATNLTSYASASVGWLQGKAQQASEGAQSSQALATQASAALSNGTGVNLDAEMANMLSLENTYATTAKLLTTVTAMFTALLDAA